MKFTEAGEVRATLRHDGRVLTASVTDSGIGIAQDVLQEIFQPFRQAELSTTRQYGGTGLGLTICRRLAALMGGEVQVASVPGRGSTFTLRLPLRRCAEEAPRADDLEPSLELDRPLRVLAAEDNATNQLVLRTLLSQIGVDLTVVSDGEQAKAAWEAGSFDLVLMDVQMPVMDGVSAARAIRQLEAGRRLARTPIIALTANAMSHQTAEYVAAGMDATVTKPLDIAQLLETMRQVLQQPRERQAASAAP